MLHQKQKFKLENASFRNYSDSDFVEVFNLFVDFQNKAEVKYFDIKDIKSSFLYHSILQNKFKSFLSSCNYKYVGVDQDRNKIFAFGGYTDLDKDTILVDFICKSEEYYYTPLIKETFLNTLKGFKNKKIRVVLGKRNKYESYINFVFRSVKHEYVGEDTFGRKIIDLDLT